MIGMSNARKQPAWSTRVPGRPIVKRLARVWPGHSKSAKDTRKKATRAVFVNWFVL